MYYTVTDYPLGTVQSDGLSIRYCTVTDYPLGTVLRVYENKELPEKKHFIWCASFLIYTKQKMTK